VSPSLRGKQTASGRKRQALYLFESNYAHRVFGWSELHSWREGKYLYVQAPKKELYDQNTDPNALKNLATTFQSGCRYFGCQLSDFRKKTSGAETAAKRDPAQMESLRLSLSGTDGGGSNTKDQALIDPRTRSTSQTRFMSMSFEP